MYRTWKRIKLNLVILPCMMTTDTSTKCVKRAIELVFFSESSYSKKMLKNIQTNFDDSF